MANLDPIQHLAATKVKLDASLKRNSMRANKMAQLGESDKKLMSGADRRLKLIKTGSLPEGIIPDRMNMGVIKQSKMLCVQESTVSSNNSSSVSEFNRLDNKSPELKEKDQQKRISDLRDEAAMLCRELSLNKEGKEEDVLVVDSAAQNQQDQDGTSLIELQKV